MDNFAVYLSVPAQYFRLGHFDPGTRIVDMEDLGLTLSVLAEWQGAPLNYATLGKRLGISYKSIQKRICCLAEHSLILLLPPLQPATRKAPKLYLTEAAASLLSSSSGQPAASLPGAPEVGFRGRMIRAVCSLETERSRFSTFWYYGGYGKTHVELVVQTPLRRIGFVFLDETRLSRWCWSYCRGILKKGIIQGAFVLYHRPRIFFAADRMVVLPAIEFFESYRPWMNACLGSSRKLLLRLVRQYNTARAELKAWP
jgi:hypothetical protein